jgi:hypothetical protein
MDLLANNWAGVRGDRNAFHVKVLVPNIGGVDPTKSPAPPPVKPIPTDIPAPEPRDVPAPEPIDVPAPEPGVIPPGAKPPKHNGGNPKPRPVP